MMTPCRLGSGEGGRFVTKMHHPLVFMQRTLTFETSACCRFSTSISGVSMKSSLFYPLCSFLGWLSLKVCRSLALPSLVRLFSVRLLTGADALPVPFMPLWATITLAVALWVVAYLMRSKES